MADSPERRAPCSLGYQRRGECRNLFDRAKNHVALYLNNVYGDPGLESWFRDRWVETGKKLDMGKSCVRFHRLEDVPLEVIAETIARSDLPSFLARYRQARGSSARITTRFCWTTTHTTPFASLSIGSSTTGSRS